MDGMQVECADRGARFKQALARMPEEGRDLVLQTLDDISRPMTGSDLAEAFTRAGLDAGSLKFVVTALRRAGIKLIMVTVQ